MIKQLDVINKQQYISKIDMSSANPKSREYVSSSDSDSDSDGGKPTAKKAKKEKRDDKSEKPQKASGKTVINGVEMFELGRMRYASVSEFKGKKYVNIREYYTDSNDGKMKPGKKGVTLNLQEWQKLKACMGDLDSQIQ